MGRGCLVWVLLGLSMDAFAQEESAGEDDAEIIGALQEEADNASPEETAPVEGEEAAEEAAADEASDDEDVVEEEAEKLSGEEHEEVEASWTAPAPAATPAPAYQTMEPVVTETKPVKLSVQSGKLPVFPDELEVLHRSNTVRCEATVWVDANGRPKRLVLDECPDGLHLAALSAMEKWRWQKPTGVVPAEGVVVQAVTAFEHKNKKFYPGVTYFRTPTEVTGADLMVSLASGKMPKFPRAVSAGDDVCLIELVVDANGKTSSGLIEECTQPYAKEMGKVLKSWKWTWATPPAKGETATVITEVVFRI